MTGFVGMFIPFGKTMDLIYACGGCLIFSGYIVYDVSSEDRNRATLLIAPPDLHHYKETQPGRVYHGRSLLVPRLHQLVYQHSSSPQQRRGAVVISKL
jgi:hypothetical protein